MSRRRSATTAKPWLWPASLGCALSLRTAISCSASCCDDDRRPNMRSGISAPRRCCIAKWTCEDGWTKWKRSCKPPRDFQPAALLPGQSVQKVPPRGCCALWSGLFSDHDGLNVIQRAGNRNLYPRATGAVHAEGGARNGRQSSWYEPQLIGSLTWKGTETA